MLTTIAIFAKAPVPGLAKTRLIPRLGADNAARLQQGLTERALSVALEAHVGPVALWCAPDCAHASFRDAADRRAVALHKQVDGDLGRRMLNAFETTTGPLLLIGTDCLGITPSLLGDCAQALRSRDAVFLPVEDGGYCLIGANRPHPCLFENIPWSTGAVMAITRTRANAAGLTVAEPALLWDIDRAQDYDRAVAEGLLPLP